MQLYFSPFACSLASHITLREAGLQADLVPVTLSTKTTAAGDDYFTINARGQVPALRLDDGSVLTENSAVLQYLADRNPAAGLLPASGPDRYAVLQWMSYLGTEVHKSCFALMFNPQAPAEVKDWGRACLDERVAYLEKEIGSRSFLVGDGFTIADAYLTWALNLCQKIGMTLPPSLAAYFERLTARPAVRQAIAKEAEIASAAR